MATRKISRKAKSITSVEKMSNLVGMWALILDENEKIKAIVYILGKANDEIYIVQAVSPVDGIPNIAKLVHVSKMMDWIFLPSREIADEVMKDYRNNRSTFRFKFVI